MTIPRTPSLESAFPPSHEIPHPATAPVREVQPGRSLLVLQNPGRQSRYYLAGVTAAINRLGLRNCVVDLGEVWTTVKTDPQGLVRRMSQVLVQQKVGATLSYGFNGISDLPLDQGPPAEGVPFLRSFWEVRNIPQLMLWVDHPQWHAERFAFRPDMQFLFRSGNVHHFLKSDAHAMELERMMGWPNCHGMPMGVDPGQFKPATDIAPDYDVVAIMGETMAPPAWMDRFLVEDDPDVTAIRALIAVEVRRALQELWRTKADAGIRPELTALGERWVGYKQADPTLAAFRHWPKLVEEFPGACWFLTLTYQLYSDATLILWRFREWERRFYIGYLARHFKVGVWGGDWSAMHVGPGGWVDFLDQSKIYARGKLALNIVDGHDEEGLTLKPFEIAASGVAMVHLDCRDLARHFEPGREIGVFRTPREARELVAALLADEPRRRAMAAAARERTLGEHTWERRVEAMFAAARLPIGAFRA